MLRQIDEREGICRCISFIGRQPGNIRPLHTAGKYRDVRQIDLRKAKRVYHPAVLGKLHQMPNSQRFVFQFFGRKGADQIVIRIQGQVDRIRIDTPQG